MKFTLRIGAIGNYPEIQIDKHRFQLLKSSRAILNEALFFEEKYEILISNYLELEKEYANVAVSEMVRCTTEYREFFELILALNVRMVNLLTAVKLYQDSIVTHISVCLPEVTDIKEQTKKIFAREYDNNFEYRFMEALRNHTQHRGVPVHRASVGSHWTDHNKDIGLMEFSLYYSTRKEKLLSDKSFKVSVVHEMPDEVNLCAATRKYIESISCAHEQVRKMIGERVSESRRAFEDTVNSYKSEYDGSVIALHVYAYDNNQKVDEVSVMLDWDDVRVRLVNKNRQLINLSKRYATSHAHKK